LKKAAFISAIFLLLCLFSGAADSLRPGPIMSRPFAGVYSLKMSAGYNTGGLFYNDEADRYYYHSFVNAGTYRFYDNLGEAARRWQLTRWLHGMVAGQGLRYGYE